MADTIGRNDPCWCGSGKKLKKCHGRPPSDAGVPLKVAATTTRKPITTHKEFDGHQWRERPGLLSAVVGIKDAASIDKELMELRSAWGSLLERDDVNGMAAGLNDVEHKLLAVRYHRDNFTRA